MTPYCWICSQETITKNVKLRSKKDATINYCFNCHFEFFRYDNSALLIGDQLDKTRLESAGLNIPEMNKDFENGYNQSLLYIADYLSLEDLEANILEIGCSWGYFLKAVKDFGAKPFGIEINPIRKKYVEDKLGIKCQNDIKNYISLNLKFKKIFSFYCLEYIQNPVSFFEKLINLLEDNGEIIFITPNLDDVLKNIWDNKGYQDFFYDECAISYYSYKSVLIMAELLSKKNSFLYSQVYTKQGYSFFNHLNWYFNAKPINNNSLVGGDCLIQDIEKILSANKSKLSQSFLELINNFDTKYKNLIEQNNLGNQIIIRLKKELK